MVSSSRKILRISDKNSSSSAHIIANNNDLLIPILLHLPVKSLMVLRCVSKGWSSLISDPFFIQKYTIQARLSIPGLFLLKLSYAENSEFEFISLDINIVTSGVPFKFLNFVKDAAGLKIDGSCNGLFCCSSFRWYRSDQTYYIYNPCTNRYKIILKYEYRRNSLNSVRSVSLAFNPLISPHYKAVCVWEVGKDQLQIEIFDSETATWKRSGNHFLGHYDSFRKSGVYWNGSLHWINSSQFRKWISLSNSFCYFDMEQELLMEMPVPPIPEMDEWYDRKLGYFGAYKGRLHLIPIYNHYSTCFEILEMDNDYRCWNVKYKVDIGNLIISYPEMIPHDYDDYNFLDQGSLHEVEFSILIVREEDKEEESNMVIHIPGKIVCYKIKDMIFTTAHDLSPSLLGEESIQYRWFDAHQYIESLALV